MTLAADLVVRAIAGGVMMTGIAGIIFCMHAVIKGHRFI